MGHIEFLQKVYDSEINFSISTFWDAGFDVKLGDKLNGFLAEKTGLRDMADVCKEIEIMILEHYPESEIAALITNRYHTSYTFGGSDA